MTHPLRIALVGPVATSIPPSGSSSVELFTSLLTEGLVARGHRVTLFATGTSRTSADLHATLARGYGEDSSAWPWELCELLNLSAALERHGREPRQWQRDRPRYRLIVDDVELGCTLEDRKSVV